MKDQQTSFRALLFIIIGCLAAAALQAADSDASPPNTVHVRAFDLPPSNLLSPESRAALERINKEREETKKLCTWTGMGREQVLAFRACNEKYIYPNILARQHARYAVTIEPRKIAGVPAEICLNAT